MASIRTSINEQREDTFDKDGNPLLYSSFEPIRGASVTFDHQRDQITIEQNLLNPQDDLMAGFLSHVNDQPIWDLPERCWKLCSRRWQRKSYGVCGFYYVRTLVFESNAEEVPEGSPLMGALSDWLLSYNGKYYISHWDRNVADESSRVLGPGKWDTTVDPPAWVANPTFKNPKSPLSYENAKDRYFQPCRLPLSNDPTKVGQPAKDPLGLMGAADQNYIHIERYQTANFLTLGVPTTVSP